MQSSKRIARRDKIAFLSDQSKELEENNGEKERYTDLNAEFQRTARRD